MDGPLLLTTTDRLHPVAEGELRRPADGLDRVVVHDMAGMVQDRVLQEIRAAVS